MKKVINLDDERILRAVESQTDLTRDNSNIVEALEEAKERNNVYQSWEDAKARKLIKEGKEPYPCCNMVCQDYRQTERESVGKDGSITFHGRSDYCSTDRSHGCLFQMKDHPPNNLNYNEYMPSHVEALDMLEKHNLLKGDRQKYEKANCRYNKAESPNARHSTEIKGIDFSYIYAIMEQIEKEIPEFFNPKSDTLALAQCICVEIEKAMGIYPNIK